eukprot:jgi/Ulvmu1/4256/UM193_0004.1
MVHPCAECGFPFKPCCEGSSCVRGGICASGPCLPCGSRTQRCCADAVCLDHEQDTIAPLTCNSDDLCVYDDSYYIVPLGLGPPGTFFPPCGLLGLPCCEEMQCNDAYLCVEGECEGCGFSGEPCCEGDICISDAAHCGLDLRCRTPPSPPGTPPPPVPGCGLLFAPCCPGDACEAFLDLDCRDGLCFPCGEPGLDCCPGAACTDNAICNVATNECERCGFPGDACCPVAVCAESATCDAPSGTCVPAQEGSVRRAEAHPASRVVAQRALKALTACLLASAGKTGLKFRAALLPPPSNPQPQHRFH